MFFITSCQSFLSLLQIGLKLATPVLFRYFSVDGTDQLFILLFSLCYATSTDPLTYACNSTPPKPFLKSLIDIMQSHSWTLLMNCIGVSVSIWSYNILRVKHWVTGKTSQETKLILKRNRYSKASEAKVWKTNTKKRKKEKKQDTISLGWEEV
jgi:hypothetical protein